jgi:hypothetical protein
LERALGSTLDGYVLTGGHPDRKVFSEFRFTSVGQAYGLSLTGFPASSVDRLVATVDGADPLEVELADGTLLVDRRASDTSTIQNAIWRGRSWALLISGLYSGLNEVISALGRLPRTETGLGLHVDLERGRTWDQHPSGVVTLRTAGLIEARRTTDRSRPALPRWAGAPTAAGSQIYRRQHSGLGATSFVLAGPGAVASVVPPSGDHLEQSLAVVDGLALRFERRAG